MPAEEEVDDEIKKPPDGNFAEAAGERDDVRERTQQNSKPKKEVFKKSSPNGKITTYLGRRDFVDRGDRVDLIDGMVLVDEEYVKEKRRVIAHLAASFRYGREDLDVLGLTFRKDLISMHFQVFPPDAASAGRPLTRLQERLKKKLGEHAYPFWFEVQPHQASSVTLQPAPGDTGKPCGVDFELKTLVLGANEAFSTDKPKKHNSVRLAIRKLTYAPARNRPQPTVEVSKEFMMSPGSLHMEASLDKEMYYHGESIAVNVHLQNNSNRYVKKIKVSVVQVADICLFTTASYSCEVARHESTEGLPVGPGATLSKVYSLRPLLADNKDKRGLALDGQLKHEDTNLATSTFKDETTPSTAAARESLGIIVSYKVKVRASVGGALGGELVAELPFTLSHAKPLDSNGSENGGGGGGGLPSPLATAAPTGAERATLEGTLRGVLTAPSAATTAVAALEQDLIQLDVSDDEEDDLVFEDFTRRRLAAVDSIDAASAQGAGISGTGSPLFATSAGTPPQLPTALPAGAGLPSGLTSPLNPFLKDVMAAAAATAAAAAAASSQRTNGSAAVGQQEQPQSLL